METQPREGSNDANLIIELSEENEQLKEKIDDLNREITQWEEKHKQLKN
jgi:predicted RNase H-like nuclease (RuvC/YqgF family)